MTEVYQNIQKKSRANHIRSEVRIGATYLIIEVIGCRVTAVGVPFPGHSHLLVKVVAVALVVLSNLRNKADRNNMAAR